MSEWFLFHKNMHFHLPCVFVTQCLILILVNNSSVVWMNHNLSPSHWQKHEFPAHKFVALPTILSSKQVWCRPNFSSWKGNDEKNGYGTIWRGWLWFYKNLQNPLSCWLYNLQTVSFCWSTSSSTLVIGGKILAISMGTLWCLICIYELWELIYLVYILLVRQRLRSIHGLVIKLFVLWRMNFKCSLLVVTSIPLLWHVLQRSCRMWLIFSFSVKTHIHCWWA